MRKFFYTSALLLSVHGFSQVGINTNAPESSLDVAAKKGASDKDGLLPPRLTLTELNNKGQTLYGEKQNGAVLYISDLSGASGSGQTSNINKIGYYYFDYPAGKWAQLTPTEPWMIQGGSTQANANNQNIYQKGKVSILNDGTRNSVIGGADDLNITGTSKASIRLQTADGNNGYNSNQYIDMLETSGYGVRLISNAGNGTSTPATGRPDNEPDNEGFKVLFLNGDATDNQTALKINQSNKYVGLGTNNPTRHLDVNGNVRIRAFDDGSSYTNFLKVLVAMPDGTLGAVDRSKVIDNAQHVFRNPNEGLKTFVSRYPLEHSQMTMPINVILRNGICQGDVINNTRAYVTVTYRDGLFLIKNPSDIEVVNANGTNNTLSYSGDKTNNLTLTYTTGQTCIPMAYQLIFSYDGVNKLISVTNTFVDYATNGYPDYTVNWVQ